MNIKFLFKIKKFSDLIKISKSKRYLRILESINQFKTEDSQKKNSKRRKNLDSKFLKDLQFKPFNKINKKITQLKSFLLKPKNSKKETNQIS